MAREQRHASRTSAARPGSAPASLCPSLVGTHLCPSSPAYSSKASKLGKPAVPTSPPGRQRKTESTEPASFTQKNCAARRAFTLPHYRGAARLQDPAGRHAAATKILATDVLCFLGEGTLREGRHIDGARMSPLRAPGLASDDAANETDSTWLFLPKAALGVAATTRGE